MPTVNANGIDLYYEVNGEGPALVFAHGVGGNHASWYQQVPYFSRWYRVVTFDHRGFGNSHEPADGPGRSAYVEDLRALLDHLQIERATLVAQSMGGWTCLGFTVTSPERVSALVMADTLGGIDAPGALHERLEVVRKATNDLSQLERVLSPGFQQRNPAGAELYLNLASFNETTRFNSRGQWPVIPSPEQLAGIQVPVLFIVGREDPLAPPDVIRMAQPLIPGSAVVEVPDAGHSVYFEQPEVFNQQILHFLSEHGLGATMEAQPARAAVAG